MLVYGQIFCTTMEEQIPSSTPPQPAEQPQFPSVPQGITPEMLEAMKARAREEAIRMTILQQQAAPQEVEVPAAPRPSVPFFQPQQPQVVYVRRNLTVAELIVVFAISCGIVVGIQGAWNFASNHLPRIEIKAR
jgi:hypothetical protein